MKAVIEVVNMRNNKDIGIIRNSISSNEGILVCEIKLHKQEVHIVYDQHLLDLAYVMEQLEDLGYTVNKKCF